MQGRKWRGVERERVRLDRGNGCYHPWCKDESCKSRSKRCGIDALVEEEGEWEAVYSVNVLGVKLMVVWCGVV